MEEIFVTRHSRLLGRAPSSAQVELYRKFPDKRGFSASSASAMLLEASFLLAFMQTFEEVDGQPTNVLFFVAPHTAAWVKQQVKQIAKQMLAVPATNKAERAKRIGKLFSHVFIREDYPEEAPKRPWAVFGYKIEAAPAWMKVALL